MKRFTGIKSVWLIWLLVMTLSSCTPLPYPSSETVQTGTASWYGPQFHGKRTSSKEIFNMYDLTAAHRSLPFGTYVMVTNKENGKSVIVRINDRGPFIKGRIIDLSYAAAKTLEMVNSGVTPVKIEVLTKYSPKKSSQKFSVQVGSFIFRRNAKDLRHRLKKKYKGVYISLFKTAHQTYFRVRIKARDLKKARTISERLTNDGYSVIILEEQ